MTRIPALTTAASIIAIAFAVWSLAAPWAAAFPDRADHYKVTLFGDDRRDRIGGLRGDSGRTLDAAAGVANVDTANG